MVALILHSRCPIMEDTGDTGNDHTVEKVW